jgi:hypothetical protein
VKQFVLSSALLFLISNPVFAQSKPTAKPTSKAARSKAWEAARQQRLTRPNVRLTLSTNEGVPTGNVNLKKGRQSFANYGLDLKRMVKIVVTDKAYEEFKELVFKILKNPPAQDTKKTGKRPMFLVNLLLLPGEGKKLGLKKRSVIIHYRKGENKTVDLLHAKTVALLNKHKKGDQTKSPQSKPTSRPKKSNN